MQEAIAVGRVRKLSPDSRLFLRDGYQVAEKAVDLFSQLCLPANHGKFRSACYNRIPYSLPHVRMIAQEAHGAFRRERRIHMTCNGDDDSGQGPVQGTGGPGGNARRLDCTVKRAVKLSELFEVGPVTRLVQIEIVTTSPGLL